MKNKKESKEQNFLTRLTIVSYPIFKDCEQTLNDFTRWCVLASSVGCFLFNSAILSLFTLPIYLYLSQGTISKIYNYASNCLSCVALTD